MELTLFTNLLGAFGLGAASGLNPWIPLFGLGIAQRLGAVELSSSFDWIGATPTLIVLGALFLADLIGDKIPAIDSVLHLFGLVVAPASGAIVFAAQENLLSNTHPVLAGGVGLVLGGSVHAARSTLRPAVTATTGGIGNPIVSFVEDAVSFGLTVLAVVVPVLAFMSLVGLTVWAVVVVRRWRARRRQRGFTPQSAGGPSMPGPGLPGGP
ncbi:MAG TPA: DUF4126 domain-containing protein [Microthrixaceae bacterium]|nr:DUF4126 domain-containing protein [Microthrixaceae bacterium]